MTCKAYELGDEVHVATKSHRPGVELVRIISVSPKGYRVVNSQRRSALVSRTFVGAGYSGIATDAQIAEWVSRTSAAMEADQ